MLKVSEIIYCALIAIILLIIGISDPKMFHGNTLMAMVFVMITLLLFIFRRFSLIKPLWNIVAIFWVVMMAFFIGNYIISKYFKRK
jgi:lipopolysaccharide export LptBFGC system permease protein LptF